MAVPEALARLGPRARAALPTLIGLVRQGSENPDLLKTLVQIDPGGAQCVPALIAALTHEDHGVVAVAADCLGLLGPRAKDAVPALAKAITRDFREILDETNSNVSAAKALRRIGPQAKSAIPALIAALKSNDSVAAQVLGSFGSEARAAIPALVESARTREKDDENWFVRQAAILALGQIQPEAKAAIPVLRTCRKNLVRRPDTSPKLWSHSINWLPTGRTSRSGGLRSP